MKYQDQKIDFKYNLKTYWELMKRQKALFFLFLAVTVITEGLLIVDKFLFKRIVDDGTNFAGGILEQGIFLKTLTIIAIIFLSIVIARSIGSWLKIHLMSIIESGLVLDVKSKYFNHIVQLSHKFHTTHKTGSLISRMTRGAGAAISITDIIVFQFAPLIFQLIFVGISLAYFSLIPALIILAIAILFIVYSFAIQQVQQKYKLEYNHAEDREKGFISDVFTNIDSIKYFGKERYIKSKFKDTIEKTRFAQRKHWDFYRWFEGGQTFILGVGTLLLVYFPLKQFLAGEITMGTLVFIYTIYGNIIGPMFGFVYGLRGFYRSMADFQYLFDYGKIENDVKDKPSARDLQIKEGEIEFKNMNFNYGKKKAFCLENFNLKIKKNEKIALVGPSGCGKTTLIKLLYRLYNLQGGEILIDGKNIEEFKQESLRSELSIVPQECVLFDDTIYNNIKFSNPQATRKEIMEAIRLAQLDKIVNKFPDKEKTIVGERGVKLSGGEKQRVSIARAILANKKILVLDEATSALDSQTEHEIQKALDTLLEGRTSIIIAHRLSTIMNADRIIVMKGGSVVEQGNHNTLIRKNGEYQKLWNLQKGGYIK